MIKSFYLISNSNQRLIFITISFIIFLNKNLYVKSLVEVVKTTEGYDMDFYNMSTKKPVNHTKEFILCEINENNSTIRSNCDLTALNFTFYAFFSTSNRPKRLANLKNLKDLARLLKNQSSCEVTYMKYNFWNENLEFMNSSEENYWYEGKKLIEMYKANVYIISEGRRSFRKTIIFECVLPKSDVYLSLVQVATRTSHSRPLEPKKVTVSAFQVKLHFVPLDGIIVNLKKNQRTNNEEMNLHEEKPAQAEPKTAQRYMIFFDNKCRQCFINVHGSTMDANELIDPSFFRSVRCQLKPNSCIYNGKCYLENEKMINEETKAESVCNTNYDFISTQLVAPCSKNNGNCDAHQTCEFDELNNKVNCLNNNF